VQAASADDLQVFRVNRQLCVTRIRTEELLVVLVIDFVVLLDAQIVKALKRYSAESILTLHQLRNDGLHLLRRKALCKEDPVDTFANSEEEIELPERHYAVALQPVAFDGGVQEVLLFLGLLIDTEVDLL
jgi:hypothetical protein